MEKINNKERIPMEHYLALYRSADPEEIAKRTGFSCRAQAFTVDFLGRSYEVTWPEFQITCRDEKRDWSPLLETDQAKLLLLRFLLEGSALKSSGRFLTYREVPWGEVYYRQFNGRCMLRLAFAWGKDLEGFGARMERLGAVKTAASDAGYQFEIFPGYAVQFLLWAGDEEFPPSSQILFSDNFAAAFHAEDLVVAAEVAIGTLKRL